MAVGLGRGYLGWTGDLEAGTVQRWAYRLGVPGPDALRRPSLDRPAAVGLVAAKRVGGCTAEADIEPVCCLVEVQALSRWYAAVGAVVAGHSAQGQVALAKDWDECSSIGFHQVLPVRFELGQVPVALAVAVVLAVVVVVLDAREHRSRQFSWRGPLPACSRTRHVSGR